LTHSYARLLKACYLTPINADPAEPHAASNDIRYAAWHLMN
jgi:hypothetical protein